MVVVLLSKFAFFLSSLLHPFYVSVCEVYHNPDTLSLEISMKVFIDDMELALQNEQNPAISLSENMDDSKINEALKYYFKDKLLIEVNSKKLELAWVGFQFENDTLLCFLEGKKVKKIDVINIRNAILFEQFEEQINLTHFQYMGQMKSLKSTSEQPDGKIDTSNW